eukprot:25265_1
MNICLPHIHKIYIKYVHSCDIPTNIISGNKQLCCKYNDNMVLLTQKMNICSGWHMKNIKQMKNIEFKQKLHINIENEQFHHLSKYIDRYSIHLICGLQRKNLNGFALNKTMLIYIYIVNIYDI